MPLVSIILLPKARDQIRDTLAFTRARFGDRKAREYAKRIRHALHALEETGLRGRQCPDIHPDAWTYHIAQGTKRARHLFLYRIRERVEIGRFLYDGMALPAQWPLPGEWTRGG